MSILKPVALYLPIICLTLVRTRPCLGKSSTGPSRSLVTIEPQQTTTSQPASLPEFEEPIGNYTVAVGRDVQLSCKISNLANYRTAWLRVEDKGILTIHNNIITRNYRVGLINNDDERNFILTIKNVQPSDKGGYMCQINSVPMKYAIGYLDVLTPPTFEGAGQSEGSVTVGEGSNATLSCRASGHPAPLITWRREDGAPILLDGSIESLDNAPIKVEGATLSLSSIHRLNAGAYLCIASNGVQPSASRRQLLDVQFSPVLRIPQTEVGGSLGQPEVELSCHVELNPAGEYRWVKLRPDQEGSLDDLYLMEHEELPAGDKYDTVIRQQAKGSAGADKVHMALTIRRLEKQDFANYKCIARNSLGLQSSTVKLYESFSLDGVFRGSGAGAETSQEPAREQQNDQQPANRQAGARVPARAHTRSSWIQRGAGAGAGRSDSCSSLGRAPRLVSLLSFALLLVAASLR